MTTHRYRLEARRTNGELWEIFHGTESDLRAQAETMATVHGQKSWKFDLYVDNRPLATDKRGTWKEHGEKKP